MFVKKRLFGILGTVAIVAAACGSTTASTAPSAAAPSAAASTAASAAASAQTPSGSAGASASGEASASAGASASASSSAAAVDLADDQTLRVTLGAEDPATLDPSKGSSSTDIGVLHALNRGLLYFDKDLNVVPSLAESMPDISADGLTYTFKLRDAKYSNGDPIVAGALVYAWKRLIDPRVAAKYQAFLADVAGGQKLVDMTAAPPSDTEV